MEDVSAIFPNPTDGLLHIQTDLPNFRFLLYDISGKLLISSKEKDLNLSTYPSGIYLLHFYDGEKMIGVEKIVKR